MQRIVPGGLVVDNSYATDLPELCLAWSAAAAPEPRLLVLNEALAAELGLDAAWLASAEGVSTLVGRTVPDGATPVAQAYAGHQFGGYSPRLGDGRALLVGELVDAGGVRRDIHLKGSGRTPFARGGDGKAAVGPMLREYVISEAMHALRIPTTRSLAVVATGERIARDTMLPGAVLARVAASHVRVGTFQYAATGGPDLVRRLADHVIARHHPQAAEATNRYLALLECVAHAQARLIARWMLVGFVHGVMNTDNMTISGETIDYGPCAFMDRYVPATVFSSIDHGGRYAYANQPPIGQWNLARLAETLLPLIDDDRDRAVERATGVLTSYADTYTSAWLDGMRAKLGLRTAQPTDQALVDEMLAMLHEQQLDFTGYFRALSDLLTGRRAPSDATPVDHAFDTSWVARWRHRLADESTTPEDAAATMDTVNPVYVPRNHAVEEALTEASDHGDLTPLHRLVDAVRSPFTERPGLEDLTGPAPPSACPYRTFCGT